jgi:hypothetical protein
VHWNHTLSTESYERKPVSMAGRRETLRMVLKPSQKSGFDHKISYLLYVLALVSRGKFLLGGSYFGPRIDSQEENQMAMNSDREGDSNRTVMLDDP